MARDAPQLRSAGVGDGCLTELFADHRALRAVIDAALAHTLGRVRVPAQGAINAAAASAGCYRFLGGDASSDTAVALLRDAERPIELVYPTEAWREQILEVWGAQVESRPMSAFDPTRLAVTHLRRLAERVPEGYRVEHLDAAGLALLDENLQPNGLQIFATPADLLEHGLAIAAIAGEQIASLASSYGATSERVEVAIATHPEHRGRGLATVTAASFLLECLESGRVPDWNASNPVSKRLAARLGYREDGTIDVLWLRPARPAIHSSRETS